MRAVHTTFDKTVLPTNLLTVSEWRYFGRAWYGRAVNWETVARRYAMLNGGAIVMLSDDTLVVLTRRGEDKVSRSTYRPGTWSWDNWDLSKESA